MFDVKFSARVTLSIIICCTLQKSYLKADNTSSQQCFVYHIFVIVNNKHWHFFMQQSSFLQTHIYKHSNQDLFIKLFSVKNAHSKSEKAKKNDTKSLVGKNFPLLVMGYLFWLACFWFFCVGIFYLAFFSFTYVECECRPIRYFANMSDGQTVQGANFWRDVVEKTIP